MSSPEWALGVNVVEEDEPGKLADGRSGDKLLEHLLPWMGGLTINPVIKLRPLEGLF